MKLDGLLVRTVAILKKKEGVMYAISEETEIVNIKVHIHFRNKNNYCIFNQKALLLSAKLITGLGSTERWF